MRDFLQISCQHLQTKLWKPRKNVQYQALRRLKSHSEGARGGGRGAEVSKQGKNVPKNLV